MRPAVVLSWTLRAAQLSITGSAVALLLFFGVGPHVLGYRTLAVLSGSMSPSYPTGSEVIDTPIATANLRVGDILTYRIPVLDHHVESHRVVSIAPDATDSGWIVRTKGDANRRPDPWVTDIAAPTVWIVRADIPFAGSLVRTARSPLTLHLLRWLVPALALLWLLWGVWADDGEGDGLPDGVSDVAGI